MTPDEVSHMSSEKELIFVAGHKAIFGDKLRYYEHPFLIKRTQMKCPATSDTVTRVTNFEELFRVHAADQEAKEEDRRRVLEDRARKAGLSYQEYVCQLAEEREKREQEIVSRILGKKPDQEENDAQEEAVQQPTGTGEDHSQHPDHYESKETGDYRTRPEGAETVETAPEEPARAGDVENEHQAAVRREIEKKEASRKNVLGAEDASVTDDALVTDDASAAAMGLVEYDAATAAIQQTEENIAPNEEKEDDLFSSVLLGGIGDMDDASPDDFDMDDEFILTENDITTERTVENYGKFLTTMNKEETE